MTKETPTQIIPFGKYKDRTAAELIADASYCEWLTTQPWFREKYANVYNLVINYGAEPHDTPEHNALQARFLDDDFCLRFVKITTGQSLEKSKADAKADEDKYNLRVSKATRAWGPPPEIGTEEGMGIIEELRFEDVYDVSFFVNTRISKWTNYASPDVDATYGNLIRYAIECKPVIGDDYPSILRQIKTQISRRGANFVALVYEQFAVSNIPLESVKKIFRMSDIHMISISEIEAVQC